MEASIGVNIKLYRTELTALEFEVEILRKFFGLVDLVWFVCK